MKNAQNKPYFTSPSKDHFGEKKKENFDYLHTKPIQPQPFRAFHSEQRQRLINRIDIVIANAPRD
jgi:hypothetical protein